MLIGFPLFLINLLDYNGISYVFRFKIWRTCLLSSRVERVKQSRVLVGSVAPISFGGCDKEPEPSPLSRHIRARLNGFSVAPFIECNSFVLFAYFSRRRLRRVAPARNRELVHLRGRQQGGARVRGILINTAVRRDSRVIRFRKCVVMNENLYDCIATITNRCVLAGLAIFNLGDFLAHRIFLGRGECSRDPVDCFV